MASATIYDLCVIGGGVNGCGIARDAAGRGLKVILAEQHDLASGTSSCSSKLVHGGLRYLEHFDFRLVRESLQERDVLLRSMPHICWPLRFVMPYDEQLRYAASSPLSKLSGTFMPWLRGRRPRWMIGMGLGMYDQMARSRYLPGHRSLDLGTDEAGQPLRADFSSGFEYSDCWVDDARLVTLNAVAAQAKGAAIRPRTKVVGAKRGKDAWEIELETDGEREQVRAKCLVNASGAWVNATLAELKQENKRAGALRLVRGSHLVFKKIYDHDRCYILSGSDGRIVFIIPYENDYTLVGTTEVDQQQPAAEPCSEDETAYLIDFVNQYLRAPLKREDMVWSYSGVRPLFGSEDGSATSVTRDYTIKIDNADGPPLANIYGGKITTYRRLAEEVMHKLRPFFPDMAAAWTANASLPGGDFPVDGYEQEVAKLKDAHAYLDAALAQRLVRLYGTLATELLGDAKKIEDLGKQFGAGLSEREVTWLREREFARDAEDILWRRTKLGLRLDDAAQRELAAWLAS